MKQKLLFTIAMIFIIAISTAQTPQKFNYQAVARDTSGNLFTNKNVSFRISILQGSADGTSVYQETHQKTTNAYGQVTLTIGAGTVVSGDFSAINWGVSSYYIKTEMDANGGSAYALMGTSQLLSVPYALYSNSSGSGSNSISDANNDTKVQVEKNPNEDKIRFDLGGTEHWVMTGNRLESKNNGGSLFIGDSAGIKNDFYERNNTFIGNKSGISNTSGNSNTAIGHNSLYSNISGEYNTANGANALFTNNGSYNTALGGNALYMNAGSYNTATGVNSLYNNYSGSYNTATGLNALYNNTIAFNNTANGFNALFSNTIGEANTAFGVEALFSSVNGGDNSAFGYHALYSNLGYDNTAMGKNSLYTNTSGIANTAIGKDALYFNTAGSYNTASGMGSLFNNHDGSNNTASGFNSLRVNSSGSYNTANGMSALKNNTTANDNTAIGFNSLESNETGNSNTATGSNTLYGNQSGSNNTANGKSAMYYNNYGSNNTATGMSALFANNSGDNNTANGKDAMYYNNSGVGNTAIGFSSLYLNNIGSNNSAIGTNALFSNRNGNYNTALGESALYTNVSGSNNTIIGHQADVTFENLTNATAIGYNAKVSQSNSLVLGDTTNVSVGIGTGAPTRRLDVRGGVRILDGTQGSGRVLTSDDEGNARWQFVSSGWGWNVRGNSGTNDSINFIGTTDSVALNFRVNNAKAGTIDPKYKNTFFGLRAGNSNTTGYGNTAIGNNALQINTWGKWNTAIGSSALSYNETGDYNTAIGNLSLYANKTGFSNIAIGELSLGDNTNGNFNTASGDKSLGSNQNGNNNSAFGFGSLFLNILGSGNTAIGTKALFNNISGNDNTAIGREAGVTTDSLNNATAIGYNAKVSQSNSLVLGDTNVNVGIGTSAPTRKLTVAGTIQSTSGGVMFPDNSVQTTAAQTQYLYRHADTIFLSNGSYVVFNPLLFLMPPNVDLKNAIVQAYNATIYGVVNANNLTTQVEIDWGLTTNYGNIVVCSQNPITGTIDKQVSAFISGLQSNTTYHYCIKATNASNVSFSSDFTFTTLPSAPQVTTADASNILALSAVSGGEVTYDGGSTVTERGVCYSTSSGPTTSNTKVVSGLGTGEFTSNLTDLSAFTTYYVRAYATNAYGTSYGDEMTFTTQSGGFILTTTAASSLTTVSAICGGDITYDGGSAVTVRGVCYSTSPNPTTANPKIINGSGTGAYSVSLTGLTSNTLYYARSYATNGVGTYYGNQITFTTRNGVVSLTALNAYSITTTSATSGGNITDNGGAAVTARGVCWSLLPNPKIIDNHTVNTSGNGSFASFITGLSINNTYYVRAYATNSTGTYYSNVITFSTGIGASYQGGLIGYILQNWDPGYIAGQTHGIIIANSDQGNYNWYNNNVYITWDNTSDEIGTGLANTNFIVSHLGVGSYAAKICSDLLLNGYSDWYLPSSNELMQIGLNNSLLNNTLNGMYWTSSIASDNSDSDNHYMVTTYGYISGIIGHYIDFQNSSNNVRAVRTF